MIIRYSFLPQILQLAKPGILVQFATSLYIGRPSHSLCPTPEASELCLQTVRRLLSAAIEKEDFFAEVLPKKSADPYGHRYTDTATVLSPSISYRYLEACLITGQEDLADRTVDRLTDTADLDPAVVLRRTKEVNLPLMSRLVAFMQARPPTTPLPSLKRLGESTVITLLSQSPPPIAHQTYGYSYHRNDYQLPAELKSVLDIAVSVGGVELLSNTQVDLHETRRVV